MSYRIIDDDTERCQKWIHDNYNVAGTDMVVCIGLENNDKLVAVTGYNNFVNESCFVHYYQKNGAFIPRSYVWFTQYYPFVQVGCKAMISYISNDNKEIERLAVHIGFKKVQNLKETNTALYVSKAKNCKWLKLKVKCYGII